MRTPDADNASVTARAAANGGQQPNARASARAKGAGSRSGRRTGSADMSYQTNGCGLGPSTALSSVRHGSAAQAARAALAALALLPLRPPGGRQRAVPAPLAGNYGATLVKKFQVSVPQFGGVLCPMPSYAQSTTGARQPANDLQGAGLTAADVVEHVFHER